MSMEEPISGSSLKEQHMATLKEEFADLVDVEGVKAALESTLAGQAELDEELAGSTTGLSALKARVETLGGLQPRLAASLRSAEELGSTIAQTTRLAEGVSSRVRELDEIQRRLNEALALVADTLALKAATEGVSAALARESWEDAARHITSFHSYPQDLADARSRAIVANAEQRLGGVVEVQLNSAIEAALRASRVTPPPANMHELQDQVLRFAGLYASLGNGTKGATAWAGFIAQLVGVQADLIHRALTRTQDILAEGGTPDPEQEDVMVSFLDGLSQLYEEIAGQIEGQGDAGGGVEERFGPGAMFIMVKALREEGDRQTSRFLSLFSSSRDLDKVLEDTRQGSDSGGSGVDMAFLDELLDELAVLSNTNEVYEAFVRSRGEAAAASAAEALAFSAMKKANESFVPSESATEEENEAQKVELAEKAGAKVREEWSSKGNEFKNAALDSHATLQVMMGSYVLLEQAFMEEAVRKAVALDDVDEDALVSSMVDEVFFNLKRCTDRVYSTGNVNNVCAVLNYLNGTLTDTLVPELSDRIRNPSKTLNNSRGGDDGLRSPNRSPRGQNTNPHIAANNASTAAGNLTRMQTELTAEAEARFNSNLDKEKVKTCLLELSETREVFTKLARRAMGDVAGPMNNKMRLLLDVFGSVSMDLSEAQYADYDINDPWVSDFLAQMDRVLGSTSELLTSGNFDILVSLIVGAAVAKLESSLFQKRFNLLGGYQFDKDLRALTGFFSNLTEGTVRDKFARLHEMATLLTLEKLDELLDVWGEDAGGLAWRLTPSEVRKVLVLRVEFSAEAVHRLKL